MVNLEPRVKCLLVRNPLSMEEMIKMTTSKDCTANHIDRDKIYLSWDDMKWNIFGTVDVFNVSTKEVCRPKSQTTNIFLPGDTFWSRMTLFHDKISDVFTSMGECMQTCQKFQNSRAPYITDINSMKGFMQKMAEAFYEAGTSNYHPNKRMKAEALWLGKLSDISIVS